LDVRPGERVLEVGVGTGLSLPYYPADCHVSGVDISEPMLEQARERAEGLGGRWIDLRLMDARELAYADDSFDHVLAPYVISVVPEPARVMAEIARVCKPGGTVLVVNHFASRARPLRLAERALTPISKWIGFRLDVPREIVTGTPRLEVLAERRVNLFGLWRLIEMRRLA
jgi:phosphatidylethanolamine/phosphatidyl-N-methylethanolamine N-methyltransferase